MSTSSTASLDAWALPRLQQLLPLDDDSLRQVLQYTTTLSTADAAEHLKNLLGDDAKALEFISSFNLRRGNNVSATAPANSGNGGSSGSVPTDATSSSHANYSARAGRGGRGGKKKATIHALPARQVQGQGNTSGGYVKSRTEEDYMPRGKQQGQQQQQQRAAQHRTTVAENLALTDSRPPDATQMPLITDDASLTSQPITSKAPPSAAGPLISDSLAPKKASTSTSSSRTHSPAPHKTTKVALSGGPQMRGASTALSDLDSAIRSLEMQTNPSLAASTSSDPAELAHRSCSCMATRHPLLDIAPNCLTCGKVICVKQGLGPCTFCNTPLLTTDEIHSVLRVLKEERGEEKTRLNNAAHRRAEVSQGKARAFTGRDFLAAHSASPSPVTSDDEAESRAQAHRDKLLAFQASNARRTRVHDEAADYEVPASGTNLWASPSERAAQLKRQQRVLRELEWNSRPEWETRRMVASIDLSVRGGRVVRRMAKVEKPDFGEHNNEEGEDHDGDGGVEVNGDETSGGAFSRNPLASGLIRPLAREGKGKEREGQSEESNTRSAWRRVQMDEDDNEQWILDGGVYGGREAERVLATEEPECG